MNIKGNVHLLKHDFYIPISNEKRIHRFVNSIIILGNEITLIDTGTKDSYQTIFNYIKERGRSINEIKLLILSHSHPDHVGSAHKIKSLTNCKVIAHRAEKEWIEDLECQYQSRMVPGFYQLVNEGVKVDDFVEHNQEIMLDKNLTIQVIHSPGHSKGSINLLFKEDKILFSADSIPLVNDIPNYDDFKQLKESLEAIKCCKDYEILLSSWTEPIGDVASIQKLIMEGEEYLRNLDKVVKIHYASQQENTLSNCKQVVDSLGLPPVYVNPIVHIAFQSHFK